MIQNYINQLNRELTTGNAIEHSYRPALKSFVESINPSITAVNEPSRSEHGAPDFIFLNNNNTQLILGYAETKDINVNLDQVEKSEQLKRYLGYSNLILTNYLEFRFFRNGEKYQTIPVAKRDGTNLIPLEENFTSLEQEIKAFLECKPEKITNAKRLAKIMGGKASRIKNNVSNYLQNENEKNKELLRIYDVMKKLLVHDLEINKFADMYAQTLVYGLFVARYYDSSSDNFSRQEARDLIPASNPFLQHFFDHIVGPNFDKRLTYIVDELCDVFQVSDVQTIIQKHYNILGETTDKDPIIHFYEDFLKEYDPQLRKQMGAYYTPVPVVQFIIRAVDEVLKTEFNLPQGLADTTKIERTILQQGTKAKEKIHKVQILDPAVGTATFLNEAIKHIYTKFKGQEGLWKSYVEKELLPRLHGFELMMAPYTIAHLKLAMTLKETGVDHFDRRLGVYLTNTLEEGIQAGDDLFSFGLAEAISEESKSASVIKHDTPIMVVVGNPPYSVSSNNKSEFINQLIKDYKKDLNERKINLDDDYIKFIRFAENLIEKSGEGIVAMITNNSFIDGVTHRQMRKHLLESFDSIYILDLHGNSKKKEVSPDGSPDQNVFDIMHGVSINIFVKTGKKKKNELAKVFHSDLYGKRGLKFETLLNNSFKQIKWNELFYKEPYYFLVPKDFSLNKEYENGIKISELFKVFNSGVETAKDKFIIKFYKQEANNLKQILQDQDLSNISQLTNYADINKISQAKNDVIKNKVFVSPISYRPFDKRFTLYSSSSQGVLWRPRHDTSKHFLHNNLGLAICKRQTSSDFRHIFILNTFSERCYVSLQTGEVSYNFPLYLYPDQKDQQNLDLNSERSPNLNLEIVNEIAKQLGLSFTNEKEETKDTFAPLDILDYIYAVLHSPNYREKYKEFLKIDFPRVPYPKDKESFWKLVELGGKLRQLHLLEDPELSNSKTTYPIAGENEVEKIEYKDNSVFINPSQYFGNVPKEAWEFYIGGYQPAQKWLKDRKGRTLEYEDIVHYQKIIQTLLRTGEIMKEIDTYL